MLSLSDPWAHAHGGTLRTRGFLRAFSELGHDVVCIFPSRAVAHAQEAGRSLAVPVDPIGTRRQFGPVRRIKRFVLPMPTTLGARNQEVSAAVAAESPDVVVVSALAQAAYFDAAPAARRWLDMSDLWSEFARREAQSRPAGARQLAMLQQRQIAAAEQTRVREAAVVTAAGHSDAAILAGSTGASVSWLPTSLDVPIVPMAVPAPKVAGFIANFGYWPNRDAWHLLASRWLPRLREIGWEVAVAGLGSAELAELPGVRRLGPVGEVSDFYREVSVTLAPIRLGGGMKVKVAESLLAGRAVVGTPFAVDGFSPEVRALTHIVELDDPDFTRLAEVSVQSVEREPLAVFRPDHLREQVRRLLEAVH